MKIIKLAILCGLALSSSAFAGVVAAWDTDNTHPVSVDPEPAPWDWYDNVTVSKITMHGTIVPAPVGNPMTYAGFPSSINTNDYVGFTITPKGGYEMTLTDLFYFVAPYGGPTGNGGSYAWGYRIGNGPWILSAAANYNSTGSSRTLVFGSPIVTTEKVEFGFFASTPRARDTLAVSHGISEGYELQVNGVTQPANVPVPSATTLMLYSTATTYKIDVSEASGVAYSRDTDSLYAIGDEGEALYQITKTGQTIDFMEFDIGGQRETRAVDDPEGVAYLGNGKFMIADERRNHACLTTYVGGGRVGKGVMPEYPFGAYVGNTGLEGIAYDPLTDSLWGVEERGPIEVLIMSNISGAGPHSVTNAFPGNRFTRQGIGSISDIFVLAASSFFAEGDPRRENILVLTRSANAILEMTRAGDTVSRLDLSFLGKNTIEGITMDDDGNIYLVSEQLVGDITRRSDLHVFRPTEYPMVSRYVSAATFYFPGQLNLAEASGIAYNWDTDSLFVVEDEGDSVVQIDKRGQVLNAMKLQGGSRSQRALDDPEGIAYLGDGKFMFADERDNKGRVGSYDPGLIRTQADLEVEAYAFGAPTGNTGLEGVAMDPLTNSVWGVQESPLKLYQMKFVEGGTPLVTEPLQAEVGEMAQEYGVTSFADVFVLAASEAYAGSANILLLARDQKLVLEINRQGEVVSTLDVSNLGRTKIEGMTMDDEGVLYLVSEREEGSSSIHGGRGALHVLTLPKHEVLGSGRGRSTLVGTPNDDEIYGNPAADTLSGGAGRDTFVFKSLRDGPDTIADFVPGQDKIDVGALLDSLAYAGVNPLQDALQDGAIRVVAHAAGPMVQVRSSGSYRPVAQLSGLTLEQANRSENFLFKTHKMPASAAK